MGLWRLKIDGTIAVFGVTHEMQTPCVMIILRQLQCAAHFIGVANAFEPCCFCC